MNWPDWPWHWDWSNMQPDQGNIFMTIVEQLIKDVQESYKIDVPLCTDCPVTGQSSDKVQFLRIFAN